MQPYAININPVAASEFDTAVDAAILAQAATLDDAVKAVIANLGEQAKLMAVDLTSPTHVGAYIAGTHDSGTESPALREQAGIQIYSAPPPPPPAAVDTITQAPNLGAQPGGLLAPTPGGSPLSESTPADAGASPIPTALEPANTVPDGSAPSAGTPPEQVDPNAEATEAADEQAEADAAAASSPAPSVPVVITEPAPVVEPPFAPAPAPDAPASDAADQAIADAEAADAAEDALTQAAPPAAAATPPEPPAGA